MTKTPLYLFGEITTESVKPLIEKIIELNNSNEITHDDIISLYINSEGGSVTDAFALADVILNSNIVVNTYALGMVCSAANIVYIAGNERIAYEHSTFLFHNIKSDLCDMNIQNLEEYNKWLKLLSDWIIKIHDDSGVQPEYLEDIINNNIEKRITAQEAYDLHIVTQLI